MIEDTFAGRLAVEVISGVGLSSDSGVGSGVVGRVRDERYCSRYLLASIVWIRWGLGVWRRHL